MKPNDMTDAEFERWLKKNKITGLGAFAASQKRRRAREADVTEARATLQQSAFLSKRGYKSCGLTRAQATQLIKRIQESERAGKALGKFMRHRRDLLEAQDALKGSDAPLTLTPEMRKGIANTLTLALDFVPEHERRLRDIIREWRGIFAPERE